MNQPATAGGRSALADETELEQAVRHDNAADNDSKADVAMRLAVFIAAALALLAGVTFFLQGIGVIPGSFIQEEASGP